MSMFRRRLMIANAKGGSGGNIIYPGLIAAWSAKGKSNDDEDRATLKDLTGNGHDIALNGFAFSGMSGYGGYNYGKGKWVLKTMPAYLVYFFEKTKADKGSFAFNVSGISDFYSRTGNFIQIRGMADTGAVLKYKEIKEDGFYYIDPVETLANAIYVDMRSAGTDKTETPCNITLEMVPKYPNALVFDGVDDYGINEDMPILTDYTLIVKRELLSNNIYCSIINKRNNFNGAFWFERVNGSTWSYGTSTSINITDKMVSWQTPVSYNGTLIKKGGNADTDFIKIGNEAAVYVDFVFYSAYLFDRSLDEQEIKEFIRKYIDPEYVLPSEQPTT